MNSWPNICGIVVASYSSIEGSVVTMGRCCLLEFIKARVEEVDELRLHAGMLSLAL
jgi:hypothetical protein